LDLTNSLERTHALEKENARLNQEIAVLRANPDNAPHPAALHAKELTLALRRVSDKLDLTEASLLTRTTELAHARGDLQRTREELDRAYELASKTRAREEEGKARERSLELEIRGLDEDMRLTNIVVSDYAQLVRSLETRLAESETDSDSSSTTTIITDLVDSLAEGKSVLQKLFQDFHVENEALQAKLVRVNEKLAISESKRAAEKKLSEHDYIDLCRAQFELEKLKIDDNTAARMVSRYMYVSLASNVFSFFTHTSVYTGNILNQQSMISILSWDLLKLVTPRPLRPYHLLFTLFATLSPSPTTIQRNYAQPWMN
jgi:hypothetical protein